VKRYLKQYLKEYLKCNGIIDVSVHDFTTLAIPAAKGVFYRTKSKILKDRVIKAPFCEDNRIMDPHELKRFRNT
jgi:hypothetical protein